MSFAEPLAAQPVSPLPDEEDVLIHIRIEVPHVHELRFAACESAARRFADHWAARNRPGTVMLGPPDRMCPRLPCERLWTLP